MGSSKHNALVDNAADPKQVKNASRKEKDVRKEELSDMRAVLNTPEGRRFVWRYLALCGVYLSSFTGNSETFFNEGKRSVGLSLMRDITEADPESFITMMKQHNKDLEGLGV